MPVIRFCAMLLLAGSITLAPQSSPTDNLPTNSLERQLNDLRLRLKIPGMSAAIVRDQKMVWAKGFGFSDYDNKTIATAETPYEIASITKTFAATLLMQLVEQGKLSLDDPMSRYSTDYNDERIKVRHVLTHTSEGVPGEHFEYNGNLFDNLTDVVMKASGNQRFRLLLARRILEPIGTTGTSPGNDYTAESSAAMTQLLGQENASRYLSVLQRLAKPYRLYGTDEIIPTNNFRRGIGAATGMVSTVTDLAKYDIAIDRHVFLKKETQEAMWTPAISTKGQTLPYGSGWFVQQYHGTRLVWHNGNLPDLYSALLLKAPEKGITFLLLANSDALSSPFRLARGNVMTSAFACVFVNLFVVRDSGCAEAPQLAIRDWLDQRRMAARRAVQIDPNTYHAYLGRYQLPSGGVLTISTEDGKLFRQGSVQKFELFPESSTKYFSKVDDSEFTFVANEQGVVTHLVIRQGDEQATAKKLE